MRRIHLPARTRLTVIAVNGGTNWHHTNWVFVVEYMDGSPTAYKIKTGVAALTEIVGGPASVIISTNNTYATEYEGFAVGYDTAEEAHNAAVSVYRSHSRVYPGKIYDNVGWVKGTKEAYGGWGGYLWLLQNMVVFRTSPTNIWVSSSGVTNYIAKVLVGTIGDYAPMANVVDVGPTNWDEEAVTDYFRAGESTEVICKADFTAYYQLLYAELDMTAHRPLTEGPDYWNPFSKHVVPRSENETPGVGIRLNGDDDDSDGTADKNDSSVAGENDLIEVHLTAAPAPAPSGVEYVLKRSNSELKVWESKTKGTAILDSTDEATMTFSLPMKTVWVEKTEISDTDLELIAKATSTGAEICKKKIHFYAFTSIVVAFGGRDQPPADPPDPNFGAFHIATNLYTHGYDVHMYNGSGNDRAVAQAEADSAIDHRNVSQVAIFGYSWGGDMTFDVAMCLSARSDIGTSFNIKYTAYIDAVNEPWQPTDPAQDQLPPNTQYHVNYYQTTPAPLWNSHGDFVTGANENHDLTGTLQGIPHYTIDDQPNVRNGIISSLKNKVNR